MDAVKDLTFDRKSGWYGYVVEADIKGFLDGDEAIVNPSVNRGGCNTKDRGRSGLVLPSHAYHLSLADVENLHV